MGGEEASAVHIAILKKYIYHKAIQEAQRVFYTLFGLSNSHI